MTDQGRRACGQLVSTLWSAPSFKRSGALLLSQSSPAQPAGPEPQVSSLAGSSLVLPAYRWELKLGSDSKTTQGMAGESKAGGAQSSESTELRMLC